MAEPQDEGGQGAGAATPHPAAPQPPSPHGRGSTPEAPAIVDNPDGSKSVRLDKPIVTHGGSKTHVKLRAPKYRDFMELGDPNIVVYGAGSVMPREDMETIGKYVERLADVEPILLEQASLHDGMRLRDAVKGFFRPAGPASST